MRDEFKINTIENFLCDIGETELSDISKIIKTMIRIKNGQPKSIEKKTRPYDILEKIELNNISKNIASKITRYHVNSYDIIDDALSCISEYEMSIKEDLYDYYWNTYTDILIDLDIDNDNDKMIKEKVNEIYSKILNQIYIEIFEGRKSDIPINKRKTYIESITSYVFYKCKFLIPIEKERKGEKTECL